MPLQVENVHILCVLLIGVGVEGGLPLRDLGGALRHVSSHVLRCHPGVAAWSLYERPADGERVVP